MKRILGIFLALSFGVANAAHAEDVVGRWRIQADGGTCSASTSLGDGKLLMVFSRPPGGENEGGLMIGSGASGRVSDGPAVIELVGRGSVTGTYHARGYAELSGYWLGFGAATDLDRYPDTWQLKAMKDGEVLVDQPVTEFKAAVTALETCARKPG